MGHMGLPLGFCGPLTSAHFGTLLAIGANEAAHVQRAAGISTYVASVSLGHNCAFMTQTCAATTPHCVVAFLNAPTATSFLAVSELVYRVALDDMESARSLQAPYATPANNGPDHNLPLKYLPLK